MANNWKEELSALLFNVDISVKEENRLKHDLEALIQTEIIEKLIEEIPDELGCVEDKCAVCEDVRNEGNFREKLKSKWLVNGIPQNMAELYASGDEMFTGKESDAN